jgi:NADH-quinone oxidoreductase subunit M
MPKFSLVFLLSSLANVGLPGTSGFIGEFLTLIGSFKVNYIVTMFATSGVILSAAYSLWLCKRVIFGNFSIKQDSNVKILDLDKTETLILFSLMVLILYVGIYPNSILSTISTSVDQSILRFAKNIPSTLITK